MHGDDLLGGIDAWQAERRRIVRGAHVAGEVGVVAFGIDPVVAQVGGDQLVPHSVGQGVAEFIQSTTGHFGLVQQGIGCTGGIRIEFEHNGHGDILIYVEQTGSRGEKFLVGITIEVRVCGR